MRYAQRIDGNWVEIVGSFTTGESDSAVKRPANWCELATQDEREESGVFVITEVEPAPADVMFLGTQLVDVDGVPVRENITRAFTAQEIADRLASKRAGMIVSMRQARLALLGAGLLDDVEAAINGIADAAARTAAQIDWEYATEVRRVSPLVASLGPALGLTDAQIDALFVAAAGIG
ncbi:MAG: hypothetical protein ACKVOB_13445 [Sphingomonas sp.]